MLYTIIYTIYYILNYTIYYIQKPNILQEYYTILYYIL